MKKPRTRSASFLAILAVLLLPLIAAGPASAAGTLNGHAILTDASGKLIPWVGGTDTAYSQVLALNTDFLLNRVSKDPSTGRPAYLSQSYLNPDTLGMAGWPHNPAGLYSMLTTSGLEYSAYSGSPAMAGLARAALDAQLAGGMTAATDNWANVPYASGDPGSLTYRGASYGSSTGVGDGPGFIEPDKVGDEGLAFLKMYRYTGDTKYLTPAINAADALASHVRVGSATQSPWPFRVNAASGAVREQYSANVIGAIALFDELVRLELGSAASYRTARDTAWNWLLAYPMKNNVWANYFEDVAVRSGLDNLNQLIPMETARYLLTHPELDPAWESHVRGLLAWVRANFATTSNGASVVREQNVFNFTMGSHTSRYASINAMLYERTGDTSALEEAYRSFNWATYMVRSTGVTIDGPDVNNMWFTDGYGDFIRHFMAGMGANPLWAPAGERHILRSTSIVRNQTSGTDFLEYTTSDAAATEVLRFAGGVSRVTAGGIALPQRGDLTAQGYTYDAATGVLRIRHDSAAVVRVTAGSGAANSAPSITLTGPTAGTTLDAPASITMAATASDQDGTVARVEFLGNGSVVASDTTAPYSATWTDVPAGGHQVAARAIDDKGASATSPAVTVTVAGQSSSQWQSTDVGSVGVPGSLSQGSGTFTVTGSGADIWDQADGFHFVYRTVSGDTEIRARVAAQAATHPWALAGVMIRESLAPGSRHALAGVTPGNGLSFTYRSTTDAASSYSSGGTGSAPYWVRLVRTGATLTAYKSATGNTWTQYATANITMAGPVLVGLAVSSHDNAVAATDTFDGVSVGEAPVLDSTAPVISGVAVPSANQNGASVTWATNEPATSQVEYGTTTSYGSMTALNTSLDTDHSQVVAGLDAATTYHFRVRSTDAAGNTAVSADATFTTSAGVDTTPPAVTLTSPAAGSRLSGPVTVTAAASDDRGLAGVQLLLDGVALGAEDTSAPYSWTWSTATAADGTHVLSAQARDTSGNTAGATNVTVTVANAVTAPGGLVAAYGFNEGSGTSVADSSGNGLKGTASGTVSWVTGKYGKAVSFNGSTTVVTVADSPTLRLGTAMTLEAWVKPSSNSGWRTILMREAPGGLSYALYGSNGSRPALYGHVTSDVGTPGSAALSTSTWSHVAGTFDGVNLRLYINGTLVSTRALSGALVGTTGPLRIGGNSVWGEYFRGLIDEVRIYNRALSAAEIVTDMGRAV